MSFRHILKQFILKGIFFFKTGCNKALWKVPSVPMTWNDLRNLFYFDKIILIDITYIFNVLS